jgi:predicted RNA binding protein YcfA (HicA-like mRNA interferase family)
MWTSSFNPGSSSEGLEPRGRVSYSIRVFPSIKGRKLLRALAREPLSYEVVRQRGSHRQPRSPNHPPLRFSFHDSATIPPGLVRKILTKDIGLSEEEARRLLRSDSQETTMSEVRIRYHHEPEGWWADSPDLPGFSVAGETGVAFATDTQPEIVEENAPSRDPR